VTEPDRVQIPSCYRNQRWHIPKPIDGLAATIHETPDMSVEVQACDVEIDRHEPTWHRCPHHNVVFYPVQT